MILTVTMNPSIDMSYQLDQFSIDSVNRTTKVLKTAGGKGINVTRVLHQLNEPVLATGIIGGYLGEYLVNQMNEQLIPSDFYKSTQETRNCIAILHQGQQTELLEAGPTFSKEEELSFIDHYTNLIKDVSVVTISGSLPQGLDSDFYTKLIKIAQEKAIPVLLDTSGKALIHSLKNTHAKPFLIKPNQHEISELLEKPVATNFQELKNDLENPIFDGIEWIVVSLGADGAFVKHNDTYYKADIPTIIVVNPVGSGDSTVAGLAAGINQQLSDEEIIKYAMTTGILNTMEEQTGFINREKFDEYYQQVVVQKYE
ncbi:tagatose-6-phosphate kinase [Granulicatella balaenopterae]|uniref:Tagatose-6-phosphate kinase n=1 Tax=Granulicatella balaenopterae TaxID=137733 RepID=A0A1H9N8E0_9LACT|nr:tagatose-6-phosphate kinase [Granulicatella balaenopterae]SER32192.1 tagatose-6-phosphate kinase [Granulicatella balaenopterae]